jgi:hypothetical protein
LRDFWGKALVHAALQQAKHPMVEAPAWRGGVAKDTLVYQNEPFRRFDLIFVLENRQRQRGMGWCTLSEPGLCGNPSVFLLSLMTNRRNIRSDKQGATSKSHKQQVL